ncbi:DUF6037 family protein [Amphritea balenae]|uniref:Rloe protein n=1 Tax=Amphritea balenae TaxID=452629 RepID=A0A3P1SXM3_9GAMM|nr:DUF6037 family protein [Amphritea balenae]RRD01735.1 rloe protein [Amphritea balenae]GGK54524.1 hypothetical protein GCM10007941_00710 [Amphritea balenae]
MKLDGLVPLYKSMKTQGIDRYRLEYKCGKAIFDVFFFIDDSPYLLLFGVKGGSFSFELKVENGFVIDHKLDNDTYRKLCEVLGLEYDPEKPFSPWSFFSEFNGKVPNSAFSNQKVKPQDVAPYKSVAEEQNKIYFVGWRDNYKWGTTVQQANLDKTKELLGARAYIRCKEKNISSCWTDQKDQAIEVSLP